VSGVVSGVVSDVVRVRVRYNMLRGVVRGSGSIPCSAQMLRDTVDAGWCRCGVQCRIGMIRSG
jgi:hypothetical protein